jgi:acyl dehydratase
MMCGEVASGTPGVASRGPALADGKSEGSGARTRWAGRPELAVMTPAPSTRLLTGEDFAAPIEDRYLEDYTAGAVYEYGYRMVTEDEILSFAANFDPQPIHLDPDLAASGPFSGLIASGWHTAALFTRLYVDHYVSRIASLASPGVDELRWPAPLRPGDRVHIRCTILESQVSRTKPDRGLVRTRGQLINAAGRDVLRLDLMNLFARRPG